VGSGFCGVCSGIDGLMPLGEFESVCDGGLEEGASSAALPGTSRLDRTVFRSFVGLVEIGNRIVAGPALRSLR